MSNKPSLKTLVLVLGLVLLAGAVTWVVWSQQERGPEEDAPSSDQGPVRISIDFPQDSYQVDEAILGDKAGHYKVVPLKDEIKGVLLLKFSRDGVDRVEYPRKEEYQVPVVGEKRKYLKEEVRESVSEEEFQKRLEGQVNGTLRAFQLNESHYRAYKRGFPEAGDYTYTVAFYSCADIEENLESSCFQASSYQIDKKVDPAVRSSKTITIK